MRRLAVIVVLCGSLPAFGWGPEGHNLVARLAAAHLTPTAAARVAEILGPGITLQSVSSWPDQIRRERAAAKRATRLWPSGPQPKAGKTPHKITITADLRIRLRVPYVT